MSTELADLKSRNRAMWAAADYDEIATQQWEVGAVVVEAATIEPGMKVLDVATGTGNAAIQAAQAGAEVVGLDLAPELFDAARERAAAADVVVDWVEGDAEALPYEAESFDRVLSTFGMMFAPRHRVAGAELARVCRPGGSVVLTTWTRAGFGRLIPTIGRYLPPLPDFASPPLAWGDEAHIRQVLGGQLLLHMETRSFDWHFPSVDAMIDTFQEAFAPLVLARKMLDAERYEQVVADVRGLFVKLDVGEGATRIPAQYMLTVAHRP